MDERVVSAELEQIEPHEVDNESLFLTKYWLRSIFLLLNGSLRVKLDDADDEILLILSTFFVFSFSTTGLHVCSSCFGLYSGKFFAW